MDLPFYASFIFTLVHIYLLFILNSSFLGAAWHGSAPVI